MLKFEIKVLGWVVAFDVTKIICFCHHDNPSFIVKENRESE